ncbi:hypothetical protein AMECASPLE_035864 [Ameca splendens]|uniref:Tyrosine specific protein phosphatases domain-containing protein n=1 Tax=Ameca splendens TaxID=208324 RepID=A0ABV0YVH7_9TELE
MSQEKRNKKKNGIPDRWLDYCPVGHRIPGTRFIAFKVPLKSSLNSQVPESQSFGLWDLLDSVERQNQELGLIIDLTFTTRYYTVKDVPQSCSYIKIFIEGHRVPSDEAILSFKQAVRQFLKENQSNKRLIGVHCTHGLNRTGYLICRYLIDVDGLDPAAVCSSSIPAEVIALRGTTTSMTFRMSPREATKASTIQTKVQSWGLLWRKDNQQP